MSESRSALTFNDLLERHSLDPAEIVVFRHRPTETELNRNFDWIVAERPDLFDCYQNTHNSRTESALKRAKYVASFLRRGPGEALFIGLFEIAGWRELSSEEWAVRPLHRELETYGMAGASGGVHRDRIAEFDLRENDVLQDWKRRLVIGWPGLERSWYRWADRNAFPVLAITEEDALQPAMPPWEQIRIAHREIAILPSRWRDALRQWRGVYMIEDTADRRCYVGSAGGAENLLQRWQDYGRTGHGGNKHLRNRDPAGFKFCILQRVSPDLDREALVAIENGWKMRLGTIWPDGLNDR